MAFMLSLLMGIGSVSAQGCDAYFPMEKGDYRVMKSYDKKDKLTGTVKQKVIKVEDIEGGKSLTVEMESYDDKDELTFSDELVMSCKDGVFTVDMKNYLNYQMMQGLEGVTVNIDATELEMPADMQPGMALKDGSIHVQATNMGIPMLNMEVRIYDRKVEGMEEITTPAGTFNCYKLTYNTEVKSFGKYEMKSIEWVAKDVGSVRSESYDKKDKLSSYSVLTELNK